MSKNKPKSVRKLEVLRLLVQGRSYGAIAEELGVSERTVYRDRLELDNGDLVRMLIDRQLELISKTDSIKLKLEYQDRLIGRLQPFKIDSRVQGNQSLTIEIIRPTEESEELIRQSPYHKLGAMEE